MQQHHRPCDALLPASEGEILARLRARAEIVAERPQGDAVALTFRIAPAEWERLRARYGERAPGFFGDAARESDHEGI